MDTSWSKVANWYDSHLENDNDSYQAKLILPNLKRILGAIQGKKVIDIGCGQGFFSRELAKLGATVHGIDLAEDLIKIAKHKNTDKNSKITYEVLSADSLNGIKDNEYDIAISVLAIQNMEHFTKVFNETSRVVKNGGKFIFILNHPVFRIPKFTSWEFSKVHQSRKIDKYLSQIKSEINMEPAKGSNGKKTYSFHRSLQDYMKALFSNGFNVSKFEEWISHKQSQAGPRKALEDTARKEFPLFLMIEATKNTQ